MCWHPLQVEDSIGILLGLDIGKEVVKLDSDVLGSGSQLGIVCKLNTTSIVLKALGKDLGLGKLKVNVVGLEFLKKMEDEQDTSGGLAEGNVFSLHSAEGNKLLLLGGPLNGTVGKLDDETGSGLAVVDVLWVCLVP